MQVALKRNDLKFYPDSSRVIARFLDTDDDRAVNTIRSVLDLSDSEVSSALSQTFRGYSMRHRNISRVFEKHYDHIVHLIPRLNPEPESIDYSRKLLIGYYFTMEYSIESTAFFNPSIVEHPDQTETGSGKKELFLVSGQPVKDIFHRSCFARVCLKRLSTSGGMFMTRNLSAINWMKCRISGDYSFRIDNG
jgi:hypothetical protein